MVDESFSISGKLTDEGHKLVQRVYYEDTDFSGLVYHGSYVRWCERGRSDFLRLIGLSRQELTSNPRLPNPHPEKLIATLDLETPPTSWANPTFFAITAEPVTAVGKSGSKTGTSVQPKTDSR